MPIPKYDEMYLAFLECLADVYKRQAQGISEKT